VQTYTSPCKLIDISDFGADQFNSQQKNKTQIVLFLTEYYIGTNLSSS